MMRGAFANFKSPALRTQGRLEQRRTSGRGDSQERWQKILAVSTDLFRRKGFIGTSMQDVSDAVGLLKGSLYYYIRSKEDLLFEILKDLHLEGEEIIEAVEFDSDNPMIELHTYIKKAAMFSGLNAERLMIFMRDFEYIPEDRRKEIISEREMYSQTVQRLIQEAQVKDLVAPDLDVTLAAKLVSSAITSTHEWLRPKGRRPLDDAAEDIATILVRGLEARPATQRTPPTTAHSSTGPAPKTKAARKPSVAKAAGSKSGGVSGGSKPSKPKASASGPKTSRRRKD
jgi:TetR/AcrR family transcriptional regulator, cholesterol catabolism regulator